MIMLFANKIRQLREEKGLLQRQLAATLEIDTPMYSKIERGDRRAKREQVVKLAELLYADSKELLVLWLADQVIAVVKDEREIADKVSGIVKQNIENTYI
jgi:transcriptional regulator with XRE-family HTH domain